MMALADAVHAGSIPGAEIIVVISDRHDAAGLKGATERGLETLIIERRGRSQAEHEHEILIELKARKIDLVCLAGFMRILSPMFISAYQARILNIHPSLLPAFPGLNAQSQALSHGVKWSGCTVHFVDDTLDAGPIIVQRVVPIYDEDTTEALAERILTEEHYAYSEAVALVVSGAYQIFGRRVIRSHIFPFECS
jgi:phosphoribosylglycinamide formyltransferase 1